MLAAKPEADWCAAPRCTGFCEGRSSSQWIPLVALPAVEESVKQCAEHGSLALLHEPLGGVALQHEETVGSLVQRCDRDFLLVDGPILTPPVVLLFPSFHLSPLSPTPPTRSLPPPPDPMVLNAVLAGHVSLQRLSKFLAGEEISGVKKNEEGGKEAVAIKVTDGNFQW